MHNHKETPCFFYTVSLYSQKINHVLFNWIIICDDFFVEFSYFLVEFSDFFVRFSDFLVEFSDFLVELFIHNQIDRDNKNDE
jgi:hypothetical protein